ncbi:DUF1499 domain-containing protein [Ectothiorhodospiraceae bacterium WFHF3C12]|nr:DUF1499 domain-containing protein [Ectothiorhodospiraceae bacterium WFHF3C12]
MTTRKHLAPCPDKPNCVCSDAQDRRHAIAPLVLRGDPAATWPAIGDIVAALPRTRIVSSDDDYLHAELRTPLLRFVDDLELLLDAQAGEVAVRSASRVGYSDFGVNRKRVEMLRRLLSERGLISP